MNKLSCLVFLAIKAAFVVPLACLADGLVSYVARVKGVFSLYGFLNGKKINKKRGNLNLAVNLIFCAINNKVEEMIIKKVDFRIGKINCEIKKIMQFDFEGKITIPNRFAATNETLFENFYPFLIGCEKYEVTYFKSKKIFLDLNYRVEELGAVLFAYKCCFRGGKSYKIRLQGGGAEATVKATIENSKTLRDCFCLVFEYC